MPERVEYLVLTLRNIADPGEEPFLMWEQHGNQTRCHPSALTNRLNALAAEGWRIVAAPTCAHGSQIVMERAGSTAAPDDPQVREVVARAREILAERRGEGEGMRKCRCSEESPPAPDLTEDPLPCPGCGAMMEGGTRSGSYPVERRPLYHANDVEAEFACRYCGNEVTVRQRFTPRRRPRCCTPAP